MPKAKARKPPQIMVEVMVRKSVYDLALERARAQAQLLRSIAREILFDQAAQAEPTGDRPIPRVYGANSDRRRLRFRAPANDYVVARTRLHDAGKSVTATVEEGLAAYARTGRFR